MNEAHELRKKIERCRRSLRVVHDPVSTNRLHSLIEEAETRLTEIETGDIREKLAT